MDKLTLIGLFIAVAAIVTSFYVDGGDINMLINGSAMVIVLGGSLGAILVQSLATHARRALFMLPWIIRAPKLDFEDSIIRMGQWAHTARVDGFLALEDAVQGESDPLLRRGLQLLVDGADASVLQQILDAELSLHKDRQRRAAYVFEAIGGYCPTFGMLGSVLGLVLAMDNISNPEVLSSGIASAFITTIYGVALANMVFLPIASKLNALIDQEAIYHSMLIEGLCSIAAGENPRNIELKLRAYRS